MSITATSYVWKHSPYTGVQKLIHLALADYADDNGLCYPKQSTLAEKATASERYVRETLKQMVADGQIRVIQKGRQHAYVLVLEPELSSGPERHSVPVSTGTQFRSYIEPSVEPSDQPSETSRTSGAREGEPVRNLGSFGDTPDPFDDEDRKPRPKSKLPARGTQAWCVVRFQNKALQAGHAQINTARLRRVLKQMHEQHDLDYESIDKILGTFFVRHEAKVRGANDIISVFQGMIGQLMRETSPASTSSAVERGAALRPKLIGEL